MKIPTITILLLTLAGAWECLALVDCVGETTESIVRTAHAIVVGQVLAVRPVGCRGREGSLIECPPLEVGEESPTFVDEVRFRVDTVLKGKASSEITFFVDQGVLRVSCPGPDLTPKKKALALLRRSGRELRGFGGDDAVVSETRWDYERVVSSLREEIKKQADKVQEK